MTDANLRIIVSELRPGNKCYRLIEIITHGDSMWPKLGIPIQQSVFYLNFSYNYEKCVAPKPLKHQHSEW